MRGVIVVGVIIFALAIVLVAGWMINKIEQDFENKEKQNVRKRKK